MSNKSVRWAFNFSKWNPTHSEMLLASSCIQPEEKDQLMKFVFKKDFKSSLIGRLLIRKFVHHATNLPYDQIKIVRTNRGKPIFVPPESVTKVSFNISHHGDFCVLAGEIGDVLLGVDVMKFEYSGGKTLSEFFRIMNRQFTVNEWATITKCSNEKNRLAMFCRHWCLKESYVKAIGVGITINLQSIDFKINSVDLKKHCITDDTELYFNSLKQQNWIFEEMLLNDDHCVSVAVDKNSYKERTNNMFNELNFDELMQHAKPLLQTDNEYCKKFFEKL